MKHLSLLVLLIALAFNTAPASAASQAEIVAAEIAAFSKNLAMRPATAIDLSKVSNEYCFNAKFGKGGHMIHYAIDPSITTEDVIDFINPAAFIEAGLDVTKLPRMPGLGKMKPGTLYYLPAGEHEPHHGRSFKHAFLVKSVNMD